jgi:uncharacterized protein
VSEQTSDGADTLAHTRIVLRPLASPLPLGLFAFALGSLVVGCAQLGAFGPDGGDPVVTVMLAVFVPLPQLLAAVIAFLTREPVVATLLALAGMTWPAALVVQVLDPAVTNAPRGVLYVGVGALLLLLGSTSVTAKPLVGLLVLVAALRFVANGLYDLSGVGWVQVTSGVAALATTGAAAYLGLALALEDTRHRTVLPTGRRGDAARAFTGHLPTQTGSLPREAGVRNQL